MKEFFKIVARLIFYAVFAFIVAAVMLKLCDKNENWLITSILCSVANISANIIFIYRMCSNEATEGQAKIINFKTRKQEKGKIDWMMFILEIVIVTAGVYFVLAFVTGILFEVKSWEDMVRTPVIFFAGTYIECLYKYSRIE